MKRLERLLEGAFNAEERRFLLLDSAFKKRLEEATTLLAAPEKEPLLFDTFGKLVRQGTEILQRHDNSKHQPRQF